jgi:hypothetical protein
MLTRPSPSDPDALLTEVQAADLLCLSIRTLQSWRNQNRGPAFVRAGRAIRYRKGTLVDWTSQNTCRPASQPNDHSPRQNDVRDSHVGLE